MVLRFSHSPSSASQIFVAKFSEADQLIATDMAGIICEKKCDVRVTLPPGWNLLQTCAQSLRRIESDNPRRGIELQTEPLPCQLLQQPLRLRRSWLIKARKEFAPEHRQKPIRSESRRKQQPETAAIRQLLPPFIHGGNPCARQSGCAPCFRRNNGVAGVNHVDRFTLERGRISQQS